MKLSDGVEWSLHCAVVLASLPSEATLPGSALTDFHVQPIDPRAVAERIVRQVGQEADGMLADIVRS